MYKATLPGGSGKQRAAPDRGNNVVHMCLQVTYAEVAEHALGSTGKTVVEVLLVLSQTGFCAAYVVFIYSTLPQVAPVLAPWAVIMIVVPLQVRASTVSLLLYACNCLPE